MLEVTQRLGGAELRAVGRPRGLRHPAQHGPPAGAGAARPVPAPGRRAQGEDRVRGPAADRAQAAGADQAPVRLRRRDRARLPRPQRPRGRVQGQHRGQPRHARRPQLPPRGRVRRRQRGPGQHRRQPRRPPERLGHRPVPELGRRPGPADLRDPAQRRPGAAAASTSTPSCAARAQTGPTCSMPTSAAWTPSRGRCWWPPTWWSTATLEALREARYAGWSGDLGRAILDGRESLASLEAEGRLGRDRPAAACRATRSCSRTSSTTTVWRAG